LPLTLTVTIAASSAAALTVLAQRVDQRRSPVSLFDLRDAEVASRLQLAGAPGHEVRPHPPVDPGGSPHGPNDLVAAYQAPSRSLRCTRPTRTTPWLRAQQMETNL